MPSEMQHGAWLKSCTARRASVPHRCRPTRSTGTRCERNARHRLRRSELVLRSHRDETSRIGQPSACRCSGLMCCGPGSTMCGAHCKSTSTIFPTLAGGSSSESSIDRSRTTAFSSLAGSVSAATVSRACASTGASSASWDARRRPRLMRAQSGLLCSPKRANHRATTARHSSSRSAWAP
eukprot:scaffold125000_cov63-Phaeocystis_antarctica.AAC.4